MGDILSSKCRETYCRCMVVNGCCGVQVIERNKARKFRLTSSHLAPPTSCETVIECVCVCAGWTLPFPAASARAGKHIGDAWHLDSDGSAQRLINYIRITCFLGPRL